MNHTFQTLFAVPMFCDGCARTVSDAIYHLNGITKVEANLENQLITVEGSAAPSKIVEAIQNTGRDAILRGSGSSDSAAVSILESFGDGSPSREVRGLARMVQVGPSRTLVDLTVRGVSPGSYRATIREYGDLKDGAASTGLVWQGCDAGANSKLSTSPESEPARGVLGTMEVGPDGRGSVFADHSFCVWEVVGHAMVVTRQSDDQGRLQNDGDTLVGVVARSSGTWDNDKTVCSCTGKTLWEERKEQAARGML